MSMSHPEHEDPAMAGHDDERAEAEAIRVGMEAAESALEDAADAVGSALLDLLAVDGAFELAPELTQVSRVLALVKARVAERLACLPGGRHWVGDEPEPPDGPAGPPTGVRRLETHPDASGDHNDFPHPFAPAESPAAGGCTRVPAGEGSGLYLGSPRDSLVPPPAAPQAERSRARGVALEALSAPTMGPEELRLLWAEGDR
jgi:hypothetical protein